MKSFKKTEKLRSPREWGMAYAKWIVEEFKCAADIIDIERELNRTRSMPDEDYTGMIKIGVTPNAREYWGGYNDYMEKLAGKVEVR